MPGATGFGFPEYQIIGTPDGGQPATIPINTGTPDVNACYWILNGDLGGWDSPDERVTMLTKIGKDVSSDGEIPADLHFRGRSITMELWCFAPTQAAREAAKYLLAQAANKDDCQIVAQETVEVFMNVVRSGNSNQGKLTIVDLAYGRIEAFSQDSAVGKFFNTGLIEGTQVYTFKATIELYAEDPYKYAVTSVTGDLSSTAYPYPGNVPSMNAVITITDTGGGVGPISISTTERGLYLGVPTLPPGAPALADIPTELIIDLYNKTITDGDGNNYYYLRNLTSPWLRVNVGADAMFPGIFTVPSDLPGTIVYYPAFL